MYVDAIHDQKNGLIKVVERINGKRHYRDIKADYSFYLINDTGNHVSIFGDILEKIEPTSSFHQRDFKTKLSNYKLFESDVKPALRCLEQMYNGAPTPTLHTSFIDIETEFDLETGYSEAEDANNRILSIAVYNQWQNQYYCLAIMPSHLPTDEVFKISNELGCLHLYSTEEEMICDFFDVIDDADVISGWNSKFYDLPYMINRIAKLLGTEKNTEFCLWKSNPYAKKAFLGDRETVVYELSGRVHLDYLELYKNYSYEERQSYSLDSIAEAELSEKKLEYRGTLYDLYHDDFKKFIEYNIHDVRLLDKLDKKLKYIDLANSIAHETCSLIPMVLGTIGVIDQSVLIESHRLGKIAFDKVKFDGRSEAAGGWVNMNQSGIVKWVGSVDVNSLYPSLIRTLNMSPETFVAQIELSETWSEMDRHIFSDKSHSVATFWNSKFNVLEMDAVYNKSETKKLTLVFANDHRQEFTGKEIYDMVFADNSNLCITANGSIFRTDIQGIIPSLLTRWYAERKQIQARKEEYVEIEKGISISEDLIKLLGE